MLIPALIPAALSLVLSLPRSLSLRQAALQQVALHACDASQLPRKRAAEDADAPAAGGSSREERRLVAAVERYEKLHGTERSTEDKSPAVQRGQHGAESAAAPAAATDDEELDIPVRLRLDWVGLTALEVAALLATGGARVNMLFRNSGYHAGRVSGHDADGFLRVSFHDGDEGVFPLWRVVRALISPLMKANARTFIRAATGAADSPPSSPPSMTVAGSGVTIGEGAAVDPFGDAAPARAAPPSDLVNYITL